MIITGNSTRVTTSKTIERRTADSASLPRSQTIRPGGGGSRLTSARIGGRGIATADEDQTGDAGGRDHQDCDLTHVSQARMSTRVTLTMFLP